MESKTQVDWIEPIYIDSLEELQKVVVPENKVQCAFIGEYKVPYIWNKTEWCLMMGSGWWYPIAFRESTDDLKTVSVAEGTSRFAYIKGEVFVFIPKLKKWANLDKIAECGCQLWE
jgi:hypothetical protein